MNKFSIGEKVVIYESGDRLHGEITGIDGDIFKVKVQDETAIPSGRYEVILNMSNRFKKYMPLLLNVPNFSGIRIHAGNTKEHTEGCILVGVEDGNDGFLGNSRSAFNELMKVLRKVEKKEKIYITIQ